MNIIKGEKIMKEISLICFALFILCLVVGLSIYRQSQRYGDMSKLDEAKPFFVAAFSCLFMSVLFITLALSASC